MFYFSRLLYKKFSPNPRSDGLIYGNSISRYLSILIDLFLLMMFMKCYQFIFSKLFYSWIGVVDFNVMRKAQLNLTMSNQEISNLKNFKFKYFIMNVSQLFIIPFYFYFSWYHFSGSIGQIVLGLRIVRDGDGEIMSKKLVMKRLFASIIMPLTFMISFFWSFVDKKRQSLHDKIVDTVIVTKSSLKKQGIYKSRYDIFDLFIMPKLNKFYSAVKDRYNNWKLQKKS